MQILKVLLCETDPLSSLSPGGTSFNIQNLIPHKSQKAGFFLETRRQTSAREDGAGERKGAKRVVECRLKASTHIWEHDVGCSSHLTPTRRELRHANYVRSFYYVDIEMPFQTASFLRQFSKCGKCYFLIGDWFFW